MTVRRSVSKADPMREPELAWRAGAIARQAEAMGLLADLDEASLGLERVRAALRTLAEHGIGVDAAALLERKDVHRARSSRLIGALDRVREALEDSPIPDLEVRQLERVFGWDQLAVLLHASVVSLRRYASGQRAAPDEVAARAHWLATVVGDLRSAYNDAGIRRWFTRPRSALDGRAPATLLEAPWSPDDPQVRAIRELAAWLTLPGPAT
jgi:hypothetical protein